MCRTGGRRCEHNWSEAQHQADLARRRAIYAARSGSVAAETSKQNTGVRVVNTVTTTTSVEDAPNCITNMTRGKQDCNLSYKDYAKVSSDSDATYEIREFEAYSSEIITGQIVPQELDVESYQTFGFEDASRWNEEISHPDADAQAEATSIKELQALTLQEQTALAVFTTDSYRTINRYLHESPRAEELDANAPKTRWFDRNSGYTQKTLDEEYTDFATSDDEERRFSQQLACARTYSRKLDIDEDKITPSILTSYVDTIDTAFSKADGKQRVVYRGEKFQPGNDTRFHGYDSVEEYADKHYSIGNQVSFKGMQSTSSAGTPAKSYADSPVAKGGILYEISSPSGIALTSVSSFAGEKEVLLPRNSQYIVVGKKYVKGYYGKKIAVIQMVEVDENNNIRHAGNLRKKDEFGAFDVTQFVSDNQDKEELI